MCLKNGQSSICSTNHKSINKIHQKATKKKTADIKPRLVYANPSLHFHYVFFFILFAKILCGIIIRRASVCMSQQNRTKQNKWLQSPAPAVHIILLFCLANRSNRHCFFLFFVFFIFFFFFFCFMCVPSAIFWLCETTAENRTWHHNGLNTFWQPTQTQRTKRRTHGKK